MFAQGPLRFCPKPASSHPSVICHMTHMTGDQFCLATAKSLGIPGADLATRPPQEDKRRVSTARRTQAQPARRPRKEIGRKEVSETDTRPYAGEGETLPLPYRPRSPDLFILSPLLASRTPRVRPPRPASPSPPGNESLLNGTSTARTPPREPRIGRAPAGRGERTPTPSGPLRPNEATSGPRGRLSGDNVRGPGDNFRGRGLSSGGGGRRHSSPDEEKPIAAATFDTHGCVGGFRCGHCARGFWFAPQRPHHRQ